MSTIKAWNKRQWIETVASEMSGDKKEWLEKQNDHYKSVCDKIMTASQLIGKSIEEGLAKRQEMQTLAKTFAHFQPNLSINQLTEGLYDDNEKKLQNMNVQYAQMMKSAIQLMANEWVKLALWIDQQEEGAELKHWNWKEILAQDLEEMVPHPESAKSLKEHVYMIFEMIYLKEKASSIVMESGEIMPSKDSALRL